MTEKEKTKLVSTEKRKADESEPVKDLKKAKLETKALKAKRPGFTDERYHETSYYIENVTSQPITIVHMDDDIVVVNKPASIPVHPCGRYRHNTVVFILAKEYNLKNLRTIHRLDRLTSGLLLFGRSPKKARQMEHQIRNRQVQKEYICRVEGEFPEGIIECKEPIEVVSYKIGVCKVSPKGKECTTTFQKLGFNGNSSVVLCKPLTGRMHQIRVHLQYLGYPVVNDPLYNHDVFGPAKGRGGDIGGKSDEQLVKDLINIHNAENWLGIDGDSDLSMFKPMKNDLDDVKGQILSDDDSESVSREASPCSESPRPVSLGSESPHENMCASMLVPNALNASVTSSGISTSVSASNCSSSGVSAMGTNTILCNRMQSQKRTKPKSAWECTKRATTPSPTSAVAPSAPQVDDAGATLQECNKLVTVPAGGAATAATTTGGAASATDLAGANVTVATQTGHESPDLAFNPDKMTTDKHCYECKVRYRDPKPQDLVMYLHAWKYKGPGWEYETELPEWAKVDWHDNDFE
uniref:Pseudouridylate synthase RPUSD2 n=1 Tax=Anopheles farauti TaxID=69004 RepID=A0A182QC43_9DIPT